MKTRPWTGKLNHDNSLSADWGCLRDDHGTPIAEVHVPIGNDDAESRRKNEDPTTERLSRIKDCCNACMEMDDPVKEIQELRAALSGRTVSCARCNEMAQQVPAIESLLMDRPWIGVDLDGTLAHYDEWRGIEHIGPPIEAMRLRVLQWLAEGQEVRILTARVGPQRHDVPHTIAKITGHIEDWCLTHLGQKLPVTSQKDYCMVEFWDDRCVQVVPNEGRSLAGEYAAAEKRLAEIAKLPEKWKQDPGVLSWTATMRLVEELEKALSRAPTAEEVSREEFEKEWRAYCPGDNFTVDEKAAAWHMWQARASREVKVAAE